MNRLEIGFYVRALLRRLHVILAITLALLLTATLVVRHMSPVYTASAKILVEAPQIPTDLARSTVSIGGLAQLQVLQQQITTRDALLTLARKLDVYRANPVRPDDEDVVQDMRSRIKFDQLQLDSQSPDQGIAVYEVSFRANNAVLSADVANALVEIILSRNKRERAGRAGDTLRFFDQKVARLSAELKRLDAENLQFMNSHNETLPESLSFRRSEQSSLQDKLSTLDREEAELRTSKNQLIMSYTNVGQVTGAAPLTPEQQTLVDLNRALAEQLALFTDNSPNIVALRARIAKVREGLIPSKPDAVAKDPADQHKPAFGLELQLPVIEERLQSIAREKLDATARIEELTKSIAATPATETALATLQRNRENVQLQYNAAIAQRAEALTGEQIENRTDSQRFSLLERATPPSKPTGLKPKIIIALGSVAGVGLGIALVLLLEILNKTVRRPKDLRKLQMEPLGVVPVIWTQQERRVSRIMTGTAVFLSAGAVPVSLMLVHYYYAPLNQVLQQLLSRLV
jgi:uncharacterized protein involved in exopolysaccharide biosynthesis